MITTRIIMATTLCGRIAPTGFTSPEDRIHLERWRDATHASLCGATNVREGKAVLRGTDGHLDPDRIRAVVTRSGNLDPGLPLFSGGPPPLVFCPDSLVTTLEDRLEGHADILGMPLLHESLDLCLVLTELEKRGVNALLIEGGGGLNFEALNQGVVDELLLTLCPVIHGTRGAPSLADSPFSLPLSVRFDLVESRTGTHGELFCRYRIHRND